MTGSAVNYSATATEPNGTFADASARVVLGMKGYDPDHVSHASLRIYGCRIYESGELVHDFAPFAEDSTIGLRDAVTGDIAVFPQTRPRTRCRSAARLMSERHPTLKAFGKMRATSRFRTPPA